MLGVDYFPDCLSVFYDYVINKCILPNWAFASQLTSKFYYNNILALKRYATFLHSLSFDIFNILNSNSKSSYILFDIIQKPNGNICDAWYTYSFSSFQGKLK